MHIFAQEMVSIFSGFKGNLQKFCLKSTKKHKKCPRCRFHGHYLTEKGRFCRLFPADTSMDSTNPYNQKYINLIRKFKSTLREISDNYPNTKHTVIHECDFLDLLANSKSDVAKYYHGKSKDKYFDLQMVVRDSMRGGHVDLYCLTASTHADDEMEVFFLDFNRYGFFA